MDLAVRSGAAVKSLANGDLQPGVSAHSFNEIHSFQVHGCAGTYDPSCIVLFGSLEEPS